MKTYFPAIFYVDVEDNSWINVEIMGILGAFTCGEGYDDAIFMAKDCLKCMLRTKNVLHRVTPYELAKRMCDNVKLVGVDEIKKEKWIEFIEIDLPENVINEEGIFLNNIENYFPNIESKEQNDKIKFENLKKYKLI